MSDVVFGHIHYEDEGDSGFTLEFEEEHNEPITFTNEEVALLLCEGLRGLLKKLVNDD